MASLPNVTGDEVVQAFKKAGFHVNRVKGSHHIMKKESHPYRLSVPVHSGKTLPAGTLRALIRQAGLSVEQFVAYLK